jgi:hypothetical protein
MAKGDVVKDQCLGPSGPINVTGYVLPWRLDEDQPVMVELNGTFFVPVFSTEAKLNESLLAKQVKFAIKHIHNGSEFLASCLPQMRVMVDPWITDHGTTRWTEPTV